MERRLEEVNSWDEVPEFSNEDEEDEFWNSHALGAELLKDAARRPEAPPALRASADLERLGLSPGISRRLQRIARIRGVRAEDLVHEFLMDRLNEEEKQIGA